jgi:hypothetical protein
MNAGVDYNDLVRNKPEVRTVTVHVAVDIVLQTLNYFTHINKH